MSTRYLNVDCILKSDHDLQPILTLLGSQIFVLWNESSSKGSSIAFETTLLTSTSPQEDILELIRLIDSMPEAFRHLVASCQEKIMDIGFESGESHIDTAIDISTLNQLNEYGFSLAIRIYGAMSTVEVSKGQGQ